MNTNEIKHVLPVEAQYRKLHNVHGAPGLSVLLGVPVM